MTKKQIFQCAWQMYKQKYTTPQTNRFQLFGQCLSRVHETYSKDRAEMKLKRLVDIMCKGIANFEYLKVDTNEVRKAKGTLNPNLIPSDKLPKTQRAENDSIQKYWDIEAKGFRCFRKSNLVSISN